ncbi:MAG: DUF2103 domain-containing protein [Minisyncoccia bacterium]
MTKDSRAGGKFCRSHTTCIHAATIVADIAHSCEQVTKVSLGHITASRKSSGGIRRVKIRDDGKSLLLGVRDSASYQELRVYASDLLAAKNFIAKGVLGAGIKVEFMDAPH